MNVTELQIEQCCSFEQTINLKDQDLDFDLTGYTLSGSLKKSYSTPESQSIPFTILVSNEDHGIILVSLTDHQTTIASGNYVWDIIATHYMGDITKVAKGTATVFPSATLTPEHEIPPDMDPAVAQHEARFDHTLIGTGSFSTFRLWYGA